MCIRDSYITAALLLDIINVSGWTPDEMADITGRPALLTTFTFGKYRGKACLLYTSRCV